MSASWLTGWLTGDVVTAAEFKKGVGAIYDTTLAAPAASIDITSIPATYKNLLLVVRAQSAVAGNSDDVYCRINGDGAGNYDFFGPRANNTTVVPVSAFGSTAGIFMGTCPAANYNTRFSANMMVLIAYSNTTYRKSTKSEGGFASNAVGTSYYDAYSGFWNSVAAITQLTIRCNGGNLVAGSGATLYAMGA